MSGSFGDDYSIAKDCQDITALVDKTGARNIFGLSSGAIIVLRSALALPTLARVALYEPPFSIHGSAPVSWMPRYDKEIAEGRLAHALITILKGIRIDPVMAALPRFLLAPLIALGIRSQNDVKGDDVTLSALIPTQHYDMRLVAETADSLSNYRELAAHVLLLGGMKSPGFLGLALDELMRVLPHARRVTLTGLGHSGPDDSGKPEQVAVQLRDFFGNHQD